MKFQHKVKNKFQLFFFVLVILPLATGFFLLSLHREKQKSLPLNPVQINSVQNTPKTPVENPVFKPIFYRVVLHGNENKNEIALSFDADMTYFMKKELDTGKLSSFYNKKVIEILEQEKVPATLFLVGLWAESYPQVTKELFQNPLFEIGNHSYSHPAFSKPCFKLPPIKEQKREEEFFKSQEAIKNITGVYPKLFRFPGGCFQKNDLSLAKKFGLTVVHWNVDGRDAFNTDVNTIIKTVERETKPGSILIFHMHGGKNAPKTAEALPTVIDYLRKKGFTFVKIGELVSEL